MLLSSLFATGVSPAAELAPLQGRVEEFIRHEEARVQQTLSADQRDAIQAAMAAYGNVTPGAAISEAAVMHALERAALARKLPLEEVRALAPAYVEAAALAGSAEGALGLGVILLPYLEEAGLCRGDALTEEGKSCTFMGGAADVDMLGEVFDAASGAYLPVARIDQTPLAGLLGTGTASATSGGAQPNATPAVPTKVAYATPYGYGYIYRYKCGGGIFNFNCDVWAEFDAAVNLQYLATGSDIVGGVLPVGINCGWSCIWSAIGKLISGKDIVAHLLGQPHRNFHVRGPGSYGTHALAPVCGGVAPVAYDGRPSYVAVTNGDFRAPYEGSVKLKFGTYYQKAPAATVAPLSRNMFPVPTSVAAQTSVVTAPLSTWRYDFDAVVAWSFDIVFAGADNVDAARTCKTAVAASRLIQGMGGTVTGNEFWAWHGQDKSWDGRGLGGVNMIFAFSGGHMPLTVK